MQIRLLSSRFTASGNGMGAFAPPVVRYKGSRRPGRRPYALGRPRPAMGWPASEASAAVGLARRAIDSHLTDRAPADPSAPFRTEPLPAVFEERRGVFVTLKRAESRALRGCIGYPLPQEPLRVAIPRVAVAAAVEDPRFPPVTRGELGRLVIELSVLTLPTLIAARAPQDRLAEVIVGRDGLIVEGRGGSGLLLPQVPVEEAWDSREFLAGTCEKAGLPLDAWLDVRTRIYRFQAEVFGESAPGGPVAVVPLTPVSSSIGRPG